MYRKASIQVRNSMENKNIKSIIFDLGNVLVDWSPSYLFNKLFKNKEEEEYFLNNICTMQWHSEQDAGRSPEEGTEKLVKEHPEWEKPIRAFYARWKEMFQGPIEGSVEILKELKEKGYKVYALTNWNLELFNQTLRDFPFLEWFDGRVVSGEVKMKKPGEEIYKVLLDRYEIDPHSALYIDDKKDNLAPAQRLGITAIHFEDPNQLRQTLTDLKIL
jgi:2-haloacid dehalogenase